MYEGGIEMNDQVVSTIRLSGQDAIKFANSLFRPTPDEIKDRSRYIDHINENIKIKRNDGGFEAEIADLDLSFLDNEPIRTKMNIEVTVDVKKSPVRFNSNQEQVKSKVTVNVANKDTYNKMNKEILSLAS